MWLALPGQVLRRSLLRSEACGVAVRCVRCLLPIADTRVHAVVAAFRSKRKACVGEDGATGDRRESRGDRGCARRDEPRGGDEALAVSARRSDPVCGDGRQPDIACAAQGWPRSDGALLFVSGVAVAVAVVTKGSTLGCEGSAKRDRSHYDALKTCAPSLHCYGEANIPASPNPHPNPSPSGRGAQSRCVRSCSTSGTRADASPRGIG